ncbi:MAG: tetratricopeptide repeat protein, partial [Cyclobacteriaceae bacterium]
LPEKSLTYYNTALDLSTQLADTGRIADTYINMSKVYLMMKKDTSETIDILKKVIQFSEPTQHHYLLMIAHNNLADLYLGYNEPQKALPHAQASLNYAQRVNMPFYTSSARLTFGRTYNMMGASAEALSHLKEALNLADAINSVELKSHALLLHAQAYEKQLDYKQAYQHLAQHLELYDSIFDLEQTRNINELERRYQAEKKTRELAEEQLLTAQQREKLQQQQSLLILALMLTLIFALAVGFLFYFLRQRRRRHAQQLIVLQRENELQSVRALITGEEKERTRIAKELHDGLSGLLASIRLRFGTFMDDLGPSGKGQAYEESLRLLEQASREVRQISHNLMPEILLRYGLVEALNSYFSNITQSGTLTIDFQVMGLEERLPSSFELTLYRILQELVNNIIKHSNASDVLIQISESDSLLSVTVEDNGVGFVPESASGGIGLDSIRSRVDYLSGKLDIQSEQGMGTSVYMEFVMDKKRISA